MNPRCPNAAYFLIAAILLLSGCSLFIGQDGQDGRAYISYEFVATPFYYDTNDPGIPYIGLIAGYYYETLPGTYFLIYESWDGSVWSTQYSIYINEGEPGTLFVDGADGEDLYFEMLAFSSGPSLYTWAEPLSVGHTTKNVRTAETDPAQLENTFLEAIEHLKQ